MAQVWLMYLNFIEVIILISSCRKGAIFRCIHIDNVLVAADRQTSCQMLLVPEHWLRHTYWTSTIKSTWHNLIHYEMGYLPTVTVLLLDTPINWRSPVSNSFCEHAVISPLPVVNITLKSFELSKALNTLMCTIYVCGVCVCVCVCARVNLWKLVIVIAW